MGSLGGRFPCTRADSDNPASNADRTQHGASPVAASRRELARAAASSEDSTQDSDADRSTPKKRSYASWSEAFGELVSERGG
jgi:hypothetical protein